jgi:hypothetical protein
MFAPLRTIISILLAVCCLNSVYAQTTKPQKVTSKKATEEVGVAPSKTKSETETFKRQTTHSYYQYLSQFTNPAYTGIGNKASAYYGFTWNLPLDKVYETPANLAMVDFALGKKQNHSLGLAFQNTHYASNGYDQYDIKTLQLNYSGRIHLYKDHFLRLGLGVLYERQRLYWDNLTQGDMIDPTNGFIYETEELEVGPTRSYPSYNAGLLYSFKYLQFGTSFTYFNQPRQGWIATFRKPMVVHSTLAGYIPLEKWMINPYLSLEFLKKQEGSQMKTILLTGGVLAFAPKYAYAGVAFSNLEFTRLTLGFVTFDRLRIGIDADLFLNKNTASYFSPLKTLQMHIRYVTKK